MPARKNRPIKLTKAKAALIQIEAAIRHYRVGEFVEAVTLAGAAEGCLPIAEGTGIRKLTELAERRMMDESDLGREAKARGISMRSHVISAVNLSRDWLKHANDKQPTEWEIESDEPMFMIFRALTVYDHHKGRETPSIRWFRKHLSARVVKIQAGE